MAVTECKIWQKSASFRIDNESRHTVAYRITTDANADPVDVFAGAQAASPNALPAEYDVHPQDNGAFALSIDVRQRQDNDFLHWEAVVNYGKLPPGQDPDRAQDPLQWPVRYRIDYKLVSREVTTDANGDPLLNTARDPVAVPPRLDFQIPILVAEKNYATLDEIVAIGNQFDKTSNDATWFGAQPGQAQFEGIRASELKQLNGTDYYTGTISVAIDYGANDLRTVQVDNLGWRAWDSDPEWLGGTVTTDPSTGKSTFQPGGQWLERTAGNQATLNRIIADNGEALTAYVYLDSSGRQPDSESDTVYKVAYELLPRVDYDSIGIGG